MTTELSAVLRDLGKRRIYVVSGESLAEWTVNDLPEMDALRAALERPAPAPATGEPTAMRTFTMYRRNVPAETHDENQRNAPDEPQFEGVVFTDGTVAIRWRTAKCSTSVWDSLEDMLAIHGHPEYGSELVWHDAAAFASPAGAGTPPDLVAAHCDCAGYDDVHLVSVEKYREKLAGAVPQARAHTGQIHFRGCSLDTDHEGECVVPEPKRVDRPAPAPTVTPAATDGASLIAAERRRQIEREGYTPEHDAEYAADGSLVKAAISYAFSAIGAAAFTGKKWWPWELRYWKPKDRRTDLIRAGALIAAELDRLAAAEAWAAGQEAQ